MSGWVKMTPGTNLNRTGTCLSRSAWWVAWVTRSLFWQLTSSDHLLTISRLLTQYETSCYNNDVWKEIHSSMFETRTIFVFRLLFLHEWFSTAFDVKVFNYFFNFLSTKRTRNFFSPNFLSARITVSTMTWFTVDDSSIAWADETQEAIVILFHSVGTGLRPGLRFHTAVRRLRAR